MSLDDKEGVTRDFHLAFIPSKSFQPHFINRSSSSGYLTNVRSTSGSERSIDMGMVKNRRLSWPFFDSQNSLNDERCVKSSLELDNSRVVSLEVPSDDGRGSGSCFTSNEDIFAKKQRSVSFCPETNFGNVINKRDTLDSTVSAPGALVTCANKVFVRKVLLPPDGDWGWTVVAGGFFVSFLTLGLIRSYGIPFASNARVGFFIYTMAHSALLCSVPLNEYICFHIGPRKTAILGTSIVLISYLISFSSTSLALNILTLGLVPGYGTSLCLVSTQHIIRQYFYYKRLLALTLSASGSAVGLLAWPLFLDFFSINYSVPYTFFLVGVANTGAFICAILYRPALKYYREYHIRYEVSVPQDSPDLASTMSHQLINDEQAPTHKSLIRQIRQLVKHPSFFALLATVSLSNTGSTLAVYLLPVYLIRVGYTTYHSKLALICLAIGDIVGRVACARCSKYAPKKRIVIVVLSTMTSGVAAILFAHFASSAFYAALVLATLFGLTSSNQWNSLYLQTVINAHAKVDASTMIPAVGLGNLSQGLALILACGLIDFMAETMAIFGRLYFLYCMGLFSCISSLMIIFSSLSNCKYKYEQ